MRQELEPILEARDSQLILDLSSVSHVDSSGLGTLVSIHKALDGRLALVSGPSQFTRVAELTGLTQLFHLFADLPSAQAFLTSDYGS